MSKQRLLILLFGVIMICRGYTSCNTYNEHNSCEEALANLRLGRVCQRFAQNALYPVKEGSALRHGIAGHSVCRGTRVGRLMRMGRRVCLDVSNRMAGRSPLEPRCGAHDGGVCGERDVEVPSDVHTCMSEGTFKTKKNERNDVQRVPFPPSDRPAG